MRIFTTFLKSSVKKRWCRGIVTDGLGMSKQADYWRGFRHEAGVRLNFITRSPDGSPA